VEAILEGAVKASSEDGDEMTIYHWDIDAHDFQIFNKLCSNPFS